MNNSYAYKSKLWRKSGIADSPTLNREISRIENLPNIEERVQYILGIINSPVRRNRMLFFVMYDIHSNKVRAQIFKYLERAGCYRIQRSVFLADLSVEKYEEIKQDLIEVQESYENNDSILVIPISTDYISAMKVIGESLDIDLITNNINVLIF